MPAFRFLLPALALVLAALTGCSAGFVPLTQELRDQHNLSDKDLQNLQMYVSHTVTLRRELEKGGREVTGSHKLLLVSGKTIEEVIIEEQTPGVAVAVKGAVISVSFEPGSSLDFSLADGRLVSSPVRSGREFATGPDPFPGNSNPEAPPAEASSALGGNFYLAVDPSGKMVFQGREFDVVGESLQAHILIEADTLEEVVEDRKIIKGRTLDD